MRVYVSSKLEEKNHLANITIDYIEEAIRRGNIIINVYGR
jgi:Fe-S cluster assembly iron-binding protein IscA